LDERYSGITGKTTWVRCKMTKVRELFGAKKEWSVGPGANLRGANFRSVDLRGADLRGADLTDAIFNEADLRGKHSE